MFFLPFANPQTSKVWVHCMEELYKCWNDLEQKIGAGSFVFAAHQDPRPTCFWTEKQMSPGTWLVCS